MFQGVNLIVMAQMPVSTTRLANSTSLPILVMETTPTWVVHFKKTPTLQWAPMTNSMKDGALTAEGLVAMSIWGLTSTLHRKQNLHFLMSLTTETGKT